MNVSARMWGSSGLGSCHGVHPRLSLTLLDVDGGAAGRRPGGIGGCHAVGPNAAGPHLLYQQAVNVSLGHERVERIAPYRHIILPPRY